MTSKSQSNIATLDYKPLQEIYNNYEELNYKELCDKLHIKEYAGNSKVKQLRELTGLCKYERKGHKYIITEIYKYPLKIKDGRWVDNRNDLFNVSIDNKNKSGIYIIQLNNIVYIGQTTNFKNRFTQHYTNINGNCINTQKLLKQGAMFSVLELEDNLELRLQKEKEYIIKYSKDDNYICINDNFNIKKHYNKENKKFTLKFNKCDKDKIMALLNKNEVKYYE